MNKREFNDLVERLIEIKAEKLKKGALLIEEQIEYDKIMSRLFYLSEKDSEEIKTFMKKLGYKI